MGQGIVFNVNNIINPVDSGNRKDVSGNNSLYAGNLEMGVGKDAGNNPLIEQKRRLAGKQAMKLIKDAWDRDNKSAQGIEEIEKAKKNTVGELNDMRQKMKEIEEQKQGIQKEYGVAPDSQEQKDLELLQKYQNNKNGVSYEEFSEEELSRLHELQGMERTEYQSRVLELNEIKNQYQSQANRAELEVLGMKSQITDSKLNQLKSQDMLNAKEASDKILEAANKEIVGMIIQEGKKHVEEELLDAVEKGKEEAEKKEEEEERIEEMKENREEQQALMEGEALVQRLDTDIQSEQKTDSAVEEAQKNIQRILQENNLINQDIIGLNIDLGF